MFGLTLLEARPSAERLPVHCKCVKSALFVWNFFAGQYLILASNLEGYTDDTFTILD